MLARLEMPSVKFLIEMRFFPRKWLASFGMDREFKVPNKRQSFCINFHVLAFKVEPRIWFRGIWI